MPGERGEVGRRHRVRTPVFLFVVGATSGTAFVLLHVLNFVQVIEGTPRSRVGQPGLGREAAVVAVVALTVYAAFALTGVALAAKTRGRLLWALPAVLYVLSPLPGTVLRGDGHVLRPLIDPYSSGGGGIWRFALADLFLVLLPGAVVAARTSGHGRRVDGRAGVAFLACAVLGALLYLRHQGLSTGEFEVNVDAHLPLAVLFVAGAALGTKKPWFPAIHLLLAALFATEAVWFLADWAFADTFRAAGTLEKLDLLAAIFVPSMMAVGLGALTDPLARYLRRRDDHRRASPPAPSAA